MKIDISTSNYFEGFFNVAGYVMVPVAVYLAFVNHILPGILVGLASILLLTTKYKLLIDREQGYYKEYLWIFGFENGIKKQFRQIGIVEVKPERYVQRINSVVYSKEMHFTVYAVYVHVDGEGLFAGEFKDKNKAAARAEMLSQKLGTSFYT